MVIQIYPRRDVLDQPVKAIQNPLARHGAAGDDAAVPLRNAVEIQDLKAGEQGSIEDWNPAAGNGTDVRTQT